MPQANLTRNAGLRNMDVRRVSDTERRALAATPWAVLSIARGAAVAEFLDIGEELVELRSVSRRKIPLVQDAVLDEVAHVVVDLAVGWRRPFLLHRSLGAWAAPREFGEQAAALPIIIAHCPHQVPPIAVLAQRPVQPTEQRFEPRAVALDKRMFGLDDRLEIRGIVTIGSRVFSQQGIGVVDRRGASGRHRAVGRNGVIRAELATAITCDKDAGEDDAGHSERHDVARGSPKHQRPHAARAPASSSCAATCCLKSRVRCGGSMTSSAARSATKWVVSLGKSAAPNVTLAWTPIIASRTR